MNKILMRTSMNNEIKHNQWTVLTQKHFLLSKAFFCRVFALCILFTLSLLPITAQTNTQQSTPDYISQAKIAVKKYYPQYEEYFKPIFTDLDKIDKGYQNIINENINNIIRKSKDIWTSEKNIYTVVVRGGLLGVGLGCDGEQA